jgi:hypothetical protein
MKVQIKLLIIDKYVPTGIAMNRKKGADYDTQKEVGSHIAIHAQSTFTKRTADFIEKAQITRTSCRSLKS